MKCVPKYEFFAYAASIGNQLAMLSEIFSVYQGGHMPTTFYVINGVIAPVFLLTYAVVNRITPIIFMSCVDIFLGVILYVLSHR